MLSAMTESAHQITMDICLAVIIKYLNLMQFDSPACSFVAGVLSVTFLILMQTKFEET